MTKRELLMFEVESGLCKLMPQVNVVQVIAHSLQGKVLSSRGTL